LNTPGIDNAVINGNVNPNGLSATAWFEYGEDPALSNPARTDNQAIGFGTAPLSINATLTGLNAGTTYYYRVAATNSAGTAKGTIESFATLSLPPTVITPLPIPA
jgi:phosphodiesterase/alkaline phosphatase D-like protein